MNAELIKRRARTLLVVAAGVVFAFVAARILKPTPHSAKLPPRRAAAVAPQPKVAARTQVNKPASRRANDGLSLVEQAALVASSYVERLDSFDGDKRAYRRLVRRLLADQGQSVRPVRGLPKMKTRAVAVAVQYANPMGAVVLVSGRQRIGARSYLVNVNVTLERLHSRYRVTNATQLGGP